MLTLEDVHGSVCKEEMTPSRSSIIVPPFIWRTLDSFSEDAIIMVLCDLAFDESEYVENRSTWKEELGQ